jgi:hypothetical protein
MWDWCPGDITKMQRAKSIRPSDGCQNLVNGEGMTNRSKATSSLMERATDKNKLRGLSPRANYTDRATSACRRS